MSDETRFCPYCGIKLKHPYWEHIQSKHPERYTQKETWVKLYQDYRNLGMDDVISIGSIITGKKNSCSSESEITVFKSVGISAQDVAVGKLVYDRALEEDIGQDIDF
ncbi:unnamed protein product [marine sediment metagenome]|uniref:Uncharacterized protein n=1 Tax=marine sediment metagenome TaxID=412755 RepID=X1CN48_9ZZZZ